MQLQANRIRSQETETVSGLLKPRLSLPPLADDLPLTSKLSISVDSPRRRRCRADDVPQPPAGASAVGPRPAEADASAAPPAMLRCGCLCVRQQASGTDIRAQTCGGSGCCIGKSIVQNDRRGRLNTPLGTHGQQIALHAKHAMNTASHACHGGLQAMLTPRIPFRAALPMHRQGRRPE